MWIIFLLCGFLWAIYSSFFLALATSIQSMPEKLSYVKTATFIFFILYIIAGVLFIIISVKERKRRNNKKLNKSFFYMLRHNNLKLQAIAFAMKNNLSINETEKFISSKINKFKGKLHVSEKDVIYYGDEIKRNNIKKRKSKKK